MTLGTNPLHCLPPPRTKHKHKIEIEQLLQRTDGYECERRGGEVYFQIHSAKPVWGEDRVDYRKFFFFYCFFLQLKSYELICNLFRPLPKCKISDVRTETTVPNLKMPDWTRFPPREPLIQKNDLWIMKNLWLVYLYIIYLSSILKNTNDYSRDFFFLFKKLVLFSNIWIYV